MGDCGFEGRLLRDGNRLAIGVSTRQFSEPQGVKQLMWGDLIRALPGPEYQEFDEVSAGPGATPWQLRHKVTVWGIVFQGPPLTRTTNRELLSWLVPQACACRPT
ncbi:hypothetical protein ACNKHK_03700 [Shigella flexneri]